MEGNASDRLAGDIPVLNKWTFIGALFGVTSAVIYNGLQRRPAIASIHRHITGILIGSFVGYQVGKFQDRKWAEKIYLIEDYKRRHPELFPDDPPRLQGEVHRPFAPRR